MEWIRSYVLTLTAAGILCALVRRLAGKAGKGRIVSLACGAFLILAALGPFRTLSLETAEADLGDLEYRIGREQARAAEAFQAQTDAVIREKTEAYILDKGKALGAELEVEVTLETKEGLRIPAAVEIRGPCSPYIKTKLSHMLEEVLGIPEKAQRWA